MSGDVVITQADAGRKLRIPTGGIVELRLTENPTTGMRWNLPDLPDVELLEDTYATPPDAGIGAAATRVLRLRLQLATGQGERLHLERRQDWDRATPPDAVFEVELQAE
ncbi:protease inhibitor I42 family protein [Aquicoccus sp. G2-2]|uniref:protease inhibitor I42 family protein n=1 Tax=Aquicoccus sp. G2-2 TaxID=3092120 RepID=UPI002AE03AD5|nr:protease inhibitor I42 family protein [Aquicoccus sp. G2-2]MEA1112876.1 protease inhibitor I42 family protein [Aquicoccus sp. G2-2]